MKLEGKQIGILIALVLGVIILFLPGQDRTKYRFDPEGISRSIKKNDDQIDPGTLSEWIIEGRRDFLLIDIRSETEFEKSRIKGAENIPLQRLLKKSTIEELPEDKMIILYSNGSSHASQAWLVMKAAGFDSYVLEGGLNYWNRYILNPKAPPDPGEASDDEILLFQTRMAVKAYFGGELTENSTNDTTANVPTKKKKKIVSKPKKKKLKGC